MNQKTKPLAGSFAVRIGVMLLGLFISGVAVAVTKRGNLGVSPVSSVANILSLRFTALSFGTWLFIWNCILILGQFLILRKDFRLFQLLQIPLSFLFGWFTDIGMMLAAYLPNELYAHRILWVLLGTVILGFGIAMTVIADVIMNSGEAFVKAIADTTGKQFGSVKVVFDVCSVLLSIVLSLLLFSFRIEGTREGTVIAALLTGHAVRFFQTRLRGPLTALFGG